MEISPLEEKVKSLSKIILTYKQKMIREEDLRNLCENFDFDQIINEVYINLKKVGFELITTIFLDQKFYILTTEGIEDDVTPSQYGTLALILALSKEVDENIKLSDLKEIFSEVWNSDIDFLFGKDYIRKINIEGLDIVKITPLGKATMKNISQNLQLKNLLNIFKEKKLEL
jgi:hypothetical protein